MKRIVIRIVDGAVSEIHSEEPLEALVLDDFIDGLPDDILTTIHGDEWNFAVLNTEVDPEAVAEDFDSLN